MEILAMGFILLGLIFIMVGLVDFNINIILSVVLLGIGLICIIFGIMLVKNVTSNPPYRFKIIPVHKTIDTLYNSVETKGDTITITTKLLKLKD
jgi:hypothetical protein